jgi:uncharacterized protein (DUF934 family)
MSTRMLLHDRAVVADDWQALDDEDGLPEGAQVIVTLERWQEMRHTADIARATIGVHLPNTADLAEVWPLVAERPLIELEIPAFPDGRAYSQARLLRDRYDYRGDIRVTGAGVVRDQLQGLARCGVNIFALREDQDPQACLEAFNELPDAYQPAADGTAPVWVRRRG